MVIFLSFVIFLRGSLEDEEGPLAMRYTVMNIPTVIFFKDGKEIDRKVGVMPPDVYIQVLEQNL